jgi:hypothetical protein
LKQVRRGGGALLPTRFCCSRRGALIAVAAEELVFDRPEQGSVWELPLQTTSPCDPLLPGGAFSRKGEAGGVAAVGRGSSQLRFWSALKTSVEVEEGQQAEEIPVAQLAKRFSEAVSLLPTNCNTDVVGSEGVGGAS